jgi:hypothetical protein
MARRRAWGRSYGKTRTSTAIYRIQTDEAERYHLGVEYNKYLKHKEERGYTHVVSMACQGSTHRVRLHQRGPVQLLDHKDFKGELSMVQLGSEVPRCFAFLQAYRNLFLGDESYSDTPEMKARRAAMKLPFEITEEVDALHNGFKGKSGAAFGLALKAARRELPKEEYMEIPFKARVYDRVQDICSRLKAKFDIGYERSFSPRGHYRPSGSSAKNQFNAGIRIKAFDYRFQPKGEKEDE